MIHSVRLSAPTTCYRCGGWLAEGEKVTVEWDETIEGYIHRHTRAALCRRFSANAESKRKVEHEIVMEAIYGTITNSSESREAEADEGDAVEGEEENRSESKKVGPRPVVQPVC